MNPDPAVEKMLDDNPLAAFSVYTAIQVELVEGLSREIVGCLDSGITMGPDAGEVQCDGVAFKRAYGLFWLWTLGAYEVVRTMVQAKQCFSTRVVGELEELKKAVSLIRMPFAKQELEGKGKKKTPVGGEPSVYKVTHSPPDLAYMVNGQAVSARRLLDRFSRVMAGIARADIGLHHCQAYAPSHAREGDVV